MVKLIDNMYLQHLHTTTNIDLVLIPTPSLETFISSAISPGVSVLVHSPLRQTTITCPLTHIKSFILTSPPPPSPLSPPSRLPPLPPSPLPPPSLKEQRAPHAHQVLPPSFPSYFVVHVNDASQSTKIEIFQIAQIDPTNISMHRRCSKRTMKTPSCDTH